MLYSDFSPDFNWVERHRTTAVGTSIKFHGVRGFRQCNFADIASNFGILPQRSRLSEVFLKSMLFNRILCRICEKSTNTSIIFSLM